MKRTLVSSKLQVKASPIHGYGVFAAEDIAAKAIIEECYALLFQKAVDPFNSFFFGINQYSVLALGFGSIYNHSNNPNAFIDYDPERSIVFFSALRSIKAGEEVCISYGKEWFDSRELTIRKPSLRYRLSQFIKTAPAIARFGIVLFGITLITLTISS